LQGGINTYLYANADPIAYTDPYGLTSAGMVFNPMVWGPPALMAAYWMYTHPDAAESLWDAMQREDVTDWDEAQKDIDHKNYHRTCDRPPPPGLTPCQEARWQYRQAKACMRKRQDWEDRWGNAKTKAPHQRAMNQVKQRMKNAAQNIMKYCNPCDVSP
jgi:hypothetical protein